MKVNVFGSRPYNRSSLPRHIVSAERRNSCELKAELGSNSDGPRSSQRWVSATFRKLTADIELHQFMDRIAVAIQVLDSRSSTSVTVTVVKLCAGL